MDRNKEKSKEFVKYVRGTGKEIVKLSVTLDKTGELIECGEKNGEEDVEERKSVGDVDGPEHEKK
jgi:hypothetical protein